MNHFFTQTQFDLLYRDTSDLVFFLIQKEGSFEYLFVNPSARMVFTEDPINKNLHDMVSPSHGEQIKMNYIKAIEENKVKTYQDFFLFSDVELVNETTVKPIQTEVATYILATTKEVSLEKKKEEKYLFLQSLLNMAVDPTIVVTNEGKIFDMNPTFEKTFGYDLINWRGKHFLNLPFIQKEDLPRVAQYFDSSLQGENKPSALVKRMKSNGDEGTFLVSYSPIKKDGTTVAMYILMQEVTDETELKESLRNTRHILESYKRAISKAAIVLMTDCKGNIVYANDLFEEITGFSKNELIGQHVSTVNTDAYNKVQTRYMWKDIIKKKIWRGELQNRSKKGSFYWGDTTAIPLFNEQGQIENVLIIQFDITEKKQIMMELQAVEKTFNMITENTNDLISITDEKGLVVYTSPSHERILGLSTDDILKRKFSELLVEEYRDFWECDILERVNEDEEIRLELQYQRKNDEDIWTETSIVAVKNREKEGEYQHIIVSREITERKKLEAHLHFMAYHDSLTKLHNRSYLLKEVPEIISQAEINNTSIAVLYLDGDDFKDVNDSYGHDIGDEFIRLFGQALITSIRRQDLVARIGGDEFVILLTNLSADESVRTMETTQIISRVQESIRRGWTINGLMFKPTTSIGISYFPEHGSTVDELLKKADSALYEVKRLGKDRHLVYSE
jgi:diguanylate cyclase (GGDEF)-like protein/PAS domain S-box-containing protein